MYQSFAPDMPYQENLKNYEEARKIYQTFISNEGHYKDDVAKTLTYLEEIYMHRLTLASISCNVNLSSSYLNNLRIRKAATMIKEDKLSLKEISAMVGIEDQLYFSRLFKKCMGISPSEYGKRFHQ